MAIPITTRPAATRAAVGRHIPAAEVHRVVVVIPVEVAAQRRLAVAAVDIPAAVVEAASLAAVVAEGVVAPTAAAVEVAVVEAVVGEPAVAAAITESTS